MYSWVREREWEETRRAARRRSRVRDFIMSGKMNILTFEFPDI